MYLADKTHKFREITALLVDWSLVAGAFSVRDGSIPDGRGICLWVWKSDSSESAPRSFGLESESVRVIVNLKSASALQTLQALHEP